MKLEKLIKDMPKRLGLCRFGLSDGLDIPGSFKSIWGKTNKVGCVFTIIISLMLHVEFGKTHPTLLLRVVGQ